jgi:hypothetical protein
MRFVDHFIFKFFYIQNILFFWSVMTMISFQFHPMNIKVVNLFFYVQENFVALLTCKNELC